MSRTITVTGTGVATFKPDRIVIELEVEKKDQDYNISIQKSNDSILAINTELEKQGFEPGALKTVRFSVDTDYETITRKDGSYHYKFKGYECSYDLKLELPMDKILLGKALDAITYSKANPKISIAFIIKDTGIVFEEILKRAAENARAKALALCAASNVKLGDIISIDYDWGETAFKSRTKLCHGAGPIRGPEAYFEPDDIQVDDTVTFVWEII